MELWKIFHKLFGWHYVRIATKDMDYAYVYKVRRDFNGMEYILFNRKISYLLGGGEVGSGYRWTPLTWLSVRMASVDEQNKPE